MRAFRIGVAATVIAALGVLDITPARALLLEQELECAASLNKTFAKLHSTILKNKVKCHNDDLSAKVDDDDGCETLGTKATESIDKARAKFFESVNEDCASVCSFSPDIPCIVDLGCPARHQAAPPNNSLAERCLGDAGSNPFNARSLDFPGPYCEDVLGRPMLQAGDIGLCVNELTDRQSDAIDEAIYANLDEDSGLTPEAVKCLSAIGKAVTKAIAKAYPPAASCRTARRSANSLNAPSYACALDDPKTFDTIEKGVEKVRSTVEKKCEDADIASLTGLCGTESPSTVAEAQDCLGTLVREGSIAERGVDRIKYVPFGMINITHPHAAKAYCGDGIVTQVREEGTAVGEECDGSDAPCGAGTCNPPGDLFECSCNNVPRERFIVNGDEAATDSDAGWKGASHEATHNDGFGYVTELSNCDCSAFSGATCTGTSADPVCDVYGNMEPRCSDDWSGTESCDERGNSNGTNNDADCFRCDDFSINAGTACANGNAANETLCQSQCIVDATGLPTMPATPCQNQSGCAAGQTCRGRCDNTITCEVMTEGSPLPLVSAETFVCVMLEYQTDITGTKNIVTGETELHYSTESQITLGESISEPCPICTGVCVGGASNRGICLGRCNASLAACLFDTDCTGMGDTTCLEATPDCPGGYCSLDARCSSGPNLGLLCSPDAETNFGAVSHDCPSGAPVGTIDQNFGTVTTAAVEFPVGGPCTTPWDNYECPCTAIVGGDGVPSQPNSCSAACDGGVNAGKGCAVGSGGSGSYTTCVGGLDNAKPCDADSDCDLLDCSGQANHCTAGTTGLLGNACVTNGDCGGGGLCEPPCPGGRCVPLCLQEGECVGGARAGDPCATTEQCKQCTAGNPGMIGKSCDNHYRCDSSVGSGDGICAPAIGVTCSVTDPEDGYCAAGPTNYRCNGPGFGTQNCELRYGACVANVCTMGSPSLRGDPCVVNTDCELVENVPVSSGCEDGVDAIPGTDDDIPGAGECEPRSTNCFFDNGYAIGGDTGNGDGSPTDVNINATFCVPPSATDAVNEASGFGGPSRIRRQGTAIVNVPTIP
jgi:hypothetical protein